VLLRAGGDSAQDHSNDAAPTPAIPPRSLDPVRRRCGCCSWRKKRGVAVRVALHQSRATSTLTTRSSCQRPVGSSHAPMGERSAVRSHVRRGGLRHQAADGERNPLASRPTARCLCMTGNGGARDRWLRNTPFCALHALLCGTSMTPLIRTTQDDGPCPRGGPMTSRPGASLATRATRHIGRGTLTSMRVYSFDGGHAMSGDTEPSGARVLALDGGRNARPCAGAAPVEICSAARG